MTNVSLLRDVEVTTINARILFSRCILVAATIIMVAGACGATNLLKNPGFENGLTDWTSWRCDWSSSLSRQAVTTQKVSGSYSLCLSTQSCSFGVYQAVTVTPGKAYQMNGWWKGSCSGNYTFWYDCELLDGPYNLTTADSRPQDLPYKVCTYDPPSPQRLSWAWERMSDAYYTTLALTPEITADRICRNGIRVANTTQMLVLLKTGAYNAGSSATCYYDDMSLEEVPTVTATEARTKPDSTAVMLDGVTVMAVFSDCIYVQSPNRAGGIKVVISYPYTAYVGQAAKIAGVMKTDTIGDRYIETSYILCTGAPGTARPVAMTAKSLSTVTNGARPNTLGLLVRASGAVRYIDSHTFTLDDGSGSAIKCQAPNSVTVLPSWTFASVTGISSCYKDGETYKKLLRVPLATDIAVLTH